MNRTLIASSSLLLLATVLAVVMALASACQRETVAQPVVATRPANEVWVTQKQIREAGIATADVGDRSVGNSLITTGRITFSDTRIGHVFSPVTGRVRSCLVALGQSVRRGTPLAVIESPDLGTAVSDLEKAEADLAAAQRELEREKELFDGHAAAQRDYEAAESNYRKASAERERAAQRSSLLLPGNHAPGQQYILRAPIDGDVVTRNVSLGMEVQGQYSGGNAAELFTIGNLDPVWVLADVFEPDLPRVHIGSPVLVNFVSYPGRQFAGKVDWISGVLDPGTRTAKVRCTIANADHRLRPEMFATVAIDTDGQEKLAIPRASVVRLGDQQVAFVDKGPSRDGSERFERRIVSVDDAEAGGDYVPVSRGLQAGEKVVTSGAIILAGAAS